MYTREELRKERKNILLSSLKARDPIIGACNNIYFLHFPLSSCEDIRETKRVFANAFGKSKTQFEPQSAFSKGLASRPNHVLGFQNHSPK